MRVHGPAVIETGDDPPAWWLVGRVAVRAWSDGTWWLYADVDGDRALEWLLNDPEPTVHGDTLQFDTADHGLGTCRQLTPADRDRFVVATPDTLPALRAFAAEELRLT